MGAAKRVVGIEHQPRGTAMPRDLLHDYRGRQFAQTRSAIFTRDDQMAEQFSVDANTGTVFRNRCDYLDPALPWTGVKDSGKGSGLSRFGFYGLTRRKAIHFRQKL